MNAWSSRRNADGISKFRTIAPPVLEFIVLERRGLSGKEEQRPPDENHVEHDCCENKKGKRANPPYAKRSKDGVGQRRVPMVRSAIASKGVPVGSGPLRESPMSAFPSISPPLEGGLPVQGGTNRTNEHDAD